METRQKQTLFSPESISWNIQQSLHKSLQQHQQHRKKKQELFKQWEEVCQRQQDARERNRQLLNDVRRVERQLSLFTAKTELFKKKRDNYKKDMQQFLSLPPKPDLASHYTPCENQKCSGYFRDSSLRGCCHSRDANMPISCWCLMSPDLRGHFGHSVDQSNFPDSMDFCQPRENSTSQNLKYTNSNIERSGPESCPLARYEGLKGVSEKTRQKAQNITKRSHGEMMTRKDIQTSGTDQNLIEIPVQLQILSSDSSSESQHHHSISSSKSNKTTGKLPQCPSSCKKRTTTSKLLQCSKTDHRAEDQMTSDSLGETTKDSYRISYTLTKVENRASKLKTSEKVDINSKIASRIDHDQEEDAISCQTECSDNIFDIPERSGGNHNTYSPKEADIFRTTPSAWGGDAAKVKKHYIEDKVQQDKEEITDSIQDDDENFAKMSLIGHKQGEAERSCTQLLSEDEVSETESSLNIIQGETGGVCKSNSKTKQEGSDLLGTRKSVNMRNENQISMEDQSDDEEETDEMEAIKDKKCKAYYRGSVFGKLSATKKTELICSSDEEEKEMEDESQQVKSSENKEKEIVRYFKNEENHTSMGQDVKKEKNTIEEDESDNSSEEEQEVERDSSGKSENEMHVGIGNRVEEMIKVEFINSNKNVNADKGGINKEEKDTSDETESDNSEEEEEEKEDESDISENEMNDRIVEEIIKEESITSKKKDNIKREGNNKEDTSEEDESDNNSAEEEEEKMDEGNISESEINKGIVIVEEIEKEEGTNSRKNENAKKGGINKAKKDTSEEHESDNNREEEEDEEDEEEEKDDSDISESEINDKIVRVEEIKGKGEGTNGSKNENVNKGGINAEEINTSEEDESDNNSEEEDGETRENSENEMNDRILRVEEIRKEEGINKSKSEKEKHESDDSKDKSSEEEEPTGSLDGTKNSRIDMIKNVDVESNVQMRKRDRERESSCTEECKPTPNVESTSGEDEISSESSDEEMEEESEGDKSEFGDDNEEEEIDESVNEENGITWDSEEDRPESSNKGTPNTNKEKSPKSKNVDEECDVQLQDSMDSAPRKEENFSQEPDLAEVQSTELTQEDQMEQEKERPRWLCCLASFPLPEFCNKRESSAQKKRCSEDGSIDGLEMIPVESGSVLPCQEEEPPPFCRTPESLPEASADIADSSEDSAEENPESENNAGSQQESDSEDDVHSFFD
ncbi:glutamic acid-rich protein-like [Xenopus laevis]|uniref:Glutamic acid-rich protein-like n=2 Tax=Xenopus laevis TaxID=8355 RepID=A0A8J1KIN8_XENLA|nr:glutamic acid-rich protein-like [Xenopus laevis]